MPKGISLAHCASFSFNTLRRRSLNSRPLRPRLTCVIRSPIWSSVKLPHSVPQLPSEPLSLASKLRSSSPFAPALRFALKCFTPLNPVEDLPAQKPTGRLQIVSSLLLRPICPGRFVLQPKLTSGDLHGFTTLSFQLSSAAESVFLLTFTLG